MQPSATGRHLPPRAPSVSLDLVPAPPLLLTAALRDRFLTWSREQQRNSVGWLRDQTRYLSWWQRVLRRVDLRRLSLKDHVLPPLRTQATARKLRIIVLKRFVSWLCTVEYELPIDPLSTLKVPQGRPEQWQRSKVVPLPQLVETSRHLSQRYRDALDVLCGTAWHVTELARFGRNGEVVEPTPREKRAGVAGVLYTRQKSGQPFLIPVSQTVLEAARRFRLPGNGLSVANFYKAIHRASRAAGVPRWTPGRLRHTVATYALGQGAMPAAVSAFLHQSSDYRTVRRWYAVYVAPQKIPTPR